ncbi:gliding motility-associated C-terminal domain-containing protein [Tenacibaculum finnmarkense]|uniref:gliding motility-associated C-terminal domain-containing protein n=1 Tax=Tenacibaculum finnmarkense TaxID=2781243 RepID=UPI001E5311C6|nr:gliding motility-associated C-terminal domain-containing protein [Tenacibaculum finnmarkense]MCD8399114.1 gliding motility-associated C-terminal domain-containing protein [Tenacibaculum finnmarkense genomovar ulcerans]MCG8794907.1 gliding motility-associated C-terminal domain-containing protein [Tenacibaculum finnmarkense]MCG8797234.1 gliding motility-associated C-terminal domain-containing protein [Tenacibaculum finnmarkense]
MSPEKNTPKKGAINFIYMHFILACLCITSNSFSQTDLDSDNDGILDSEECGFNICAQPIINGGFEKPIRSVSTYYFIKEDRVPGWETTASKGLIEIWRGPLEGVNAAEGNQFAELNAKEESTLFQKLCLSPGTKIKWSVKHRGRRGVDVAEVRIGASLSTLILQETMSDDKWAWGTYDGEYTVPSNQTETIFAFKSVSSTGGDDSVGNLIDDVQVIVLSSPPCRDTDKDGIPNNLDLDSDGDGCFDVLEAGFSDPDNDGILGTGTPQEDANGLVTSAPDGYTTPANLDSNTTNDYLQDVPVIIFNKKLKNTSVKIGETASFSFSRNINQVSIQWQVSEDNGNSWNTLTDDLTYSGTNTTHLSIANVAASFSGNLYRVLVSPKANICAKPNTSKARLLVAIPTKPVSISDGFSPNNDGINDTFSIKNLDTYLNHSLEIFNRYGYLVFKGTINSSPWDGTDTKGNVLPTGVYFYRIKLNEPGSELLQGRIHLRK